MKNKSLLERNQEKLENFIRILEEEIGHNARVVGIIQIGSYANNESVPGLSDIDTRVYVESDDVYIWNVAGHKTSEKIYQENKLDDFIEDYGEKPIVDLTWSDFNIPMWNELEEEFGVQIEFGLTDKRYADYALKNIKSSPTNEHSFLMKRSIIYDPDNFLSQWKQKLSGEIFSTMAEFYEDQYLNSLSDKLYNSTEITEDDLEEIESRNKIQWIKRAIRHIREAVTTKVYVATGEIVHEKSDILEFYQK
jgi:predicted nucleotidyltransferase